MFIEDISYSLGRAGRVRCAPGWSWDARMEDFDLWYVWAGNGRMWWDNQSVDLSAGTCMWLRPGPRYLAEHDPSRPLGVTYIHFTARDGAGAELSPERVPGTSFEVQDPAFFTVSAAKVVRLMRQAEIGGGEAQARDCRIRAERLFSCLIDELLSFSDGAEPGPIRRHRAGIEQQLARIYEQPAAVPPVAELAREAGLSADHYARVFRAVSGRSPRALIQVARLDRARQLMRESALSLSEISEQTGYSDVFQFSRLFKRHTGKAPSVWRRECDSDRRTT
ncbi:MAG: AraC family transcriptional regulator [Opitutales bacterium]|nr:AraC family transcriptional regulator [Opitutales bacterium]